MLSSSVIAYFFRKTSDRQDIVFPEIKIHELSSMPIKIPTNIKVFDDTSDKVISQTEQIQSKKITFTNRLKDNFNLEKISKRLESFFEFDFKSFINELKKKKIKLSLVQQDEWEEYFNAYKNQINLLQDEVNATTKEIDQMVYKLYELTEDEIEIIESSIK